MNAPLLHVIKNEIKDINKKSLKEVIEERKLIKTKIKLIQIYYLDQDIKEINKSNLGLNNFNLDNIYLTNELGLYVPLKKDIIVKGPNDKTILYSYLIYLSYLYNYNFIMLYNENKEMFLELINSLNISIKLKNNLYQILKDKGNSFFSETIEDLNNSNFRQNLHEDEMKLQRLKKM